MAEKPPPSDWYNPSPAYVPLNAAASASLTPLSSPSSRAIVKYLSACVLLLSLCIIDFSIPYWFRYCRSDAGLISYGSSGYTSSFDDVVQVCDNEEYDYDCDGFCDRTKELRAAGGIVLGLGCASMFALVVVMIRMLVFTVNPSRAYGERLVKWGLILSASLWWVAIIPYFAVFAKIVNETDTDSTFIEGGIPLSLFIGLWHVLSCPVGISLTKKQVAALPDVPQTESNQSRDQQEMEGTSQLLEAEYRRPAVLFACLSVATIGMAVTDFSLKRWVRYCSVETSLTKVYLGGDDVTFARIVELMCPTEDYGSCGDLCTDFKRLRDCSKVMLALGISSVAVLAATTVWMIVLAVKPVQKKWVGLTRVGLVLATLLWGLAAIVYISLVVEIRIDTEEVSVQAGLSLCFTIAVLQVANCAIGNLALNKLIRY